MFEDANTISIIVQAGAVGIAVLLILLLYFVLKLIRDMHKEQRDAIERNTEAHLKVAETNTKTAEALTSLKETLPHVCRQR